MYDVNEKKMAKNVVKVSDLEAPFGSDPARRSEDEFYFVGRRKETEQEHRTLLPFIDLEGLSIE